MRLLDLTDVNVGYRHTVVAGPISLTLRSGSALLIAGPNGAGKTTLLRTIVGFQKPISGTIQRFTDRLALVPQSGNRNTDMPMSIQSALQYAHPDYVRPGSLLCKNRVRSDTDRALETVGLLERRNLQIANCSGGEWQRFLIARALLLNPEVLILDEPMSALDRDARRSLIDLLQTLRSNRERPMGLILTGHELNAPGMYTEVYSLKES